MKNWNLLIFVLFSITVNSPANENKTELLIVYYSLTGNTEQMAREVMKGAQQVQGVSVKLMEVDSVKTEDVKSADAIIVGSPVYNANTSPEIQKFINSWPFKNAPLKNKLGAAFVTAGGISAGEEVVLLNILHSMLVFGMIVVGGEDWQSCFGASAIVSEEPFSKPIKKQFLDKANNLGKRVAEIALKLNH